MVDEISLAISITSIFLTVIGLLYQEFKSKVALENRIATLEAKPLTDPALAERVAKMEVKLDLWWDTVQDWATKMIKHPVTPRLDELMDRLNDKTINVKELDELKGLLECAMDEKARKRSGKVFAYAFTLARIKSLEVDLKGIQSYASQLVK